MNDMGQDYDIPVLRERMLANLGGEADAYPSRVEQRFPRILAKLVAVWGHPEAEAYLNGLLVADRSDRLGFPDDVASELFRLSMIHSTLQSGKTEDESGWQSIEDGEVDGFFSRRSRR